MRIGAIFARGSCRALKWLALVGMVFALGTGAALAQVTITVPQAGVTGATAVARSVPVTEASARVTVRVTVNVAANAPAESDFAVQLTLRVPVVATGVYPPDLVGEITATDADVYWETIGRGTLASDTLRLSWGQRPYAQVVTGDVILGTFQDDDAEDEHYDLGVDFSTTANTGTLSGSG